MKDLLRGVPARRVDGRAPARGCNSFENAGKNAGIGRLRCHCGGGSRGPGDDQLMRLGSIVLGGRRRLPARRARRRFAARSVDQFTLATAGSPEAECLLLQFEESDKPTRGGTSDDRHS